MRSNFLPSTLESDLRSKLDLRSPSFTKLRRGVTLGWLRVVTLVALDAIALSLAWILAVRHGTPLQSPWTDGSSLLSLILAIKLAVIAARGLYKHGNYRRDYLGLAKALSISELLLLFIAFLYEPDHYISRSTFLLSWVLSLSLSCVGRFGFDFVTTRVRQQGGIRYPVYLVTDKDAQEKLAGLIEQENRYNILGIADPSALDKANRDSFFESLRRMGIVEAFVSWSAIQNRLHLCWRFQTEGITLRILFADREPSLPRSEFWIIGKVPSLTVPAPLIVGSDYWTKRCFDLCCASAAVLLLSPVYLLIALLIRLDSPGSIFFRQTRVGLHGREFKVWKFRTMVANADKLQVALEAKNEMRDGVLFKMKDDPRVTRLGKFLRRYSLDELPQLFNVILGEMSLVGPRPLPARDVKRFQEGHFVRQEVLPGVTGLWQVSGRSDIDNFEDVVKLDVTYITNWSLWLDLRIIMQTIKVVVRGKGAY